MNIFTPLWCPLKLGKVRMSFFHLINFVDNYKSIGQGFVGPKHVLVPKLGTTLTEVSLYLIFLSPRFNELHRD